jgi:DNA-binding NarL/FixJ family response regulator
MNKFSTPVRVVIIKGRATFLDYVPIIEGASRFTVVRVHSTFEDAFKLLDTTNPAIVLIDIEFLDRSGLTSLRFFKKHYPDIDILMLADREENGLVIEALRIGVAGYLFKPISSRIILKALLEITEGGAPMSPPIAKLVLEEIFRTNQALSKQIL